jgi:poly(hydroxyalkanoate) depolymerase family esterase
MAAANSRSPPSLIVSKQGLATWAGGDARRAGTASAARPAMGNALHLIARLAAAASIACATAATDDDRDGPADAGAPWWLDPDGGSTTPPAGADAGRPSGPPAACTGPTGNFNGIQLIECVPGGASVGPRPLVVVLHGYTQDPEAMLASTQWDVLAGRHGFYLAFARASADYRSWYWYTAGRSRGQPDPAGLVAIVDDMKARHDIDAERVFVAGLSSGGYMAVDLLADYPDVFAGGSATSGGPHGCDVLCPHSATAGAGKTGALVRAEHPAVWSDAAARKPRLLLLHGDLDQTNLPANSQHLRAQWLDAHGADDTADNAALGLPTELGGYPYEVYAHGGEPVLGFIHMTDLGHGTPVNPGDGIDQGGFDPMPSQTADPCGVCPQDWTNTGSLWGPYYEAKFFGILE